MKTISRIPRLAYRTVTASLALLLAAAAVTAQTPAPRSAAVVNGESIPLDDVEAIVKIRPLAYGKPSETEHAELQREAVDMLIDDALLRQFLRKNAAAVRASEVNRKLGELQAALKKDGQTLEVYCRECGQTETSLRSTIVTMLQHDSYIKEHLTDADIRKYYEDNREFFDQVTVRVSHILIRVPPGSPPTQVAAEKAKLEALRQDILAGKQDFAAAARAHSECISAPSGGDVGYFPRKGAVEEPFARAAFALKQGEVSEVVQTSRGLHLIRVTDRKSGPASDFKKVEAQVRELAGEDMMMGILARERQEARVEITLADPQEAKKPPSGRRSLFGTR
jgi:parvulin-like peptidyl-prolyl isomerase